MGLNLNSYPVFDKLFGASPTKAGQALKDSFTEQDKQLILLYFKWLTKKNATNIGINQLTLTGTMSPDIKAFLEAENLANIKDWEFTGMVDYGVMGAVTCSHGGHRLRYAYYAYSPSANRELIFGQSCASDFFDVDKATLGSFVKVVNKASKELCAILNKGRYSREFTFTDEAVNCFKMLRHSDFMMSSDPSLADLYNDIATRCYRYINKTAMELWANFISRGLLLPETLREIVISGYRQASLDALKARPEYTTHLGYYLKVKNTEAAIFDTGLIKGEIIPPISNLSLTDALRVCILEEIISPTSVANRSDLLTLYKHLGILEQLVSGYKQRYTRADIFKRQMINDCEKDITDPLSCMLVGLIRNDLRIVTFMFGLTKGTLKPMSINSWADWVADRDKWGDLNIFEEVWCDNNWYANLKRFIDARHPKRSLLVLLYALLYPSIVKALTGTTKPQFHCCYLDSNYPGYPDDIHLKTIYELDNEKAKAIQKAIEWNKRSDDFYVERLYVPRTHQLDGVMCQSVEPENKSIPDDANFFSTAEDKQIEGILANLDIELSSVVSVSRGSSKKRAHAKQGDTGYRDYFGTDDTDEAELYDTEEAIYDEDEVIDEVEEPVDEVEEVEDEEDEVLDEEDEVIDEEEEPIDEVEEVEDEEDEVLDDEVDDSIYEDDDLDEFDDTYEEDDDDVDNSPDQGTTEALSLDAYCTLLSLQPEAIKNYIAGLKGNAWLALGTLMTFHKQNAPVCSLAAVGSDYWESYTVFNSALYKEDTDTGYKLTCYTFWGDQTKGTSVSSDGFKFSIDEFNTSAREFLEANIDDLQENYDALVQVTFSGVYKLECQLDDLYAHKDGIFRYLRNVALGIPDDAISLQSLLFGGDNSAE